MISDFDYQISTHLRLLTVDTIMSRLENGVKRKLNDGQTKNESRKRRVVHNGNIASDIEKLERRIAEDPVQNHKNVETLLRMIDVNDPNSKFNLNTAVSLCKVFSRVVASGHITKDGQRRKLSQEVSGWYIQHYEKYRKTVIKLLRSVSASQRLPILHLCWKILEQDAELLESSVWVSDSIFKPLLSALMEMTEAKDIRETYVSEYMNECHDCCYHSLEYFAYVNHLNSAVSCSDVHVQGHISMQAKMNKY